MLPRRRRKRLPINEIRERQRCGCGGHLMLKNVIDTVGCSDLNCCYVAGEHDAE